MQGPPPALGKFQFVILASLRAVQLTRGCLPRVEGVHKNTVIAQLEVAAGKVIQEVVPVLGSVTLEAAAIPVV